MHDSSTTKKTRVVRNRDLEADLLVTTGLQWAPFDELNRELIARGLSSADRNRLSAGFILNFAWKRARLGLSLHGQSQDSRNGAISLSEAGPHFGFDIALAKFHDFPAGPVCRWFYPFAVYRHRFRLFLKWRRIEYDWAGLPGFGFWGGPRLPLSVLGLGGTEQCVRIADRCTPFTLLSIAPGSSLDLSLRK